VKLFSTERRTLGRGGDRILATIKGVALDRLDSVTIGSDAMGVCEYVVYNNQP